MTLFGRERELNQLLKLAGTDPGQPGALVLFGDIGSGKTALARWASAAARDRGRVGLQLAARESESDAPYAALTRLMSTLGLLRPEVAVSTAALTEKMLSGASGSNLLTVAAELLSVIQKSGGVQPLFIVIDDAHLLDRESLSVLSFVFQRIGSHRATMLMTVGGLLMPRGFDRTFAEILLEPLLDPDAHQLLDESDISLTAEQRARVVRQASGNPQALIEFARSASRPEGRAWSRPYDPLPLGAQLSQRIMRRVAALPKETQTALLVATIETSHDEDSKPITDGVFENDSTALGSAERAGLVIVNHGGDRLVHPLVRSAVFHGASFAERSEVHRRLADTFANRPGVQAWHLAAASVAPDEHLAARLEESGLDALHEGNPTAAAAYFERAAELSPEANDQARRLVSAAAVAAPSGDAGRAESMAARAWNIATRIDLKASARLATAWVLASRGDFTSAARLLLANIDSTKQLDDELGWELLSVAVAVGHQSGSNEVRHRIGLAVQRMSARESRSLNVPGRARRLWIDAYLEAGTDRERLLAELRILSAQAGDDEPTLSRLGGAAWLLDETELAAELARMSLVRLDKSGATTSRAIMSSVLGWTLIDAGRWDAALEVTHSARSLSTLGRARVVAAASDAATATVWAMRGQHVEACQLARQAIAAVRREQCLAVETRAHYALGLAAFAAGLYSESFERYTRMFTLDGRPLHPLSSPPALGGLAAAGVRAGREVEARDLLRRVQAHLPAQLSPRVALVMTRAQALLGSAEDAEARFSAAVGHPDAGRWPFEKAQTQLDFAEWLRRNRRVLEARTLLESARETFRELGAKPWQDRAESELRASSVVVPGIAQTPRNVTQQQWQIARLAATGLSNSEIAERMYLSPRTVASHLYRLFPKLGIRDRAQLRDVIAREVPPGP